MRPPRQNLLYPLILLAICGATFFAHADTFPVSRMEARNLVAAREMVRDGHWLIPTMNGSLRLAKPPLPTWLSATAGLVAGDMERLSALRLPSALAAATMVLAVYGLAGTILRDRRGAFLAAAVFGTSYLVIFSGRQATWDIYCHSFMLLALWAMAAGLNREGPSLAEAALAGVCLGLSFLSKGPVAFFSMLLPFALAHGFAFGWRTALVKRGEIALTAAVLLVVALPWPLYVFATVSERAASTFQGEVAAWGSRHVKSMLYYAGFPFMTGVWSLFAFAALLSPSARQGNGDHARRKFCLAWLVGTLLLLSLTPEKKERYVLPAMVPLSMLIGVYLDGLMRGMADRQETLAAVLLRLHAGILAIASLAVPVTAVWLLRNNLGVMKWEMAITTGVFTALALGFASTLGSLDTKRILTLTIIQVMAACVLLPPLAASAGLFKYRYTSLAAIRSESRIQGLGLCYQGEIDERMVWFAGQRIGSCPDIRDLSALPVALLSRKPPAAPGGPDAGKVRIKPLASYCVDEPKCADILYLSIFDKDR